MARACILATRSSYWRWRWTMSRCTWPWGLEAALRMGFGAGALRRLDGDGWGGFLDNVDGGVGADDRGLVGRRTAVAAGLFSPRRATAVD